MKKNEMLDFQEFVGEEESQASKTSRRLLRLIMRSGLSMADFAAKYKISRRSLENWITLNEVNHREPKEVVMFLLERLVEIDFPEPEEPSEEE